MIPHDAPAVRYSLAAIVLHWLLATALLFQLALGFGLEDLGAKAFTQYQLHKSVGILILLLTLARFGVRIFLPRPAPLERGLPGVLAKSVHGGLYAFMLGAPLTGWMLVSTATIKVPTLIFGRIPLPHLPLPDSLGSFFSGAHEVMALLGVALILLHVAGALRHHWLLRDGLIYRMTPKRSGLAALLLVALLPAGWVAGRTMLVPANPRSDSPAPIATAPTPAAATPSPVEAAQNSSIADPAVESETSVPPQPEKASAEEQEESAAESTLVPPPSWTILPGGRLEFAATYGSDSYKGRFSRWSGEILMDPERPETAKISIEIDMASATMSDPTQNDMLLGEDFFAAGKFAKGAFRSSKVRKTGPQSYRAEGTLSLKGLSTPQSVRFTLSGKGARRHVAGTADIDRIRYGIGTGASAEGIAPAVTVTFTFEASADAGN